MNLGRAYGKEKKTHEFEKSLNGLRKCTTTPILGSRLLWTQKSWKLRTGPLFMFPCPFQCWASSKTVDLSGPVSAFEQGHDLFVVHRKREKAFAPTPPSTAVSGAGLALVRLVDSQLRSAGYTVGDALLDASADAASDIGLVSALAVGRRMPGGVTLRQARDLYRAAWSADPTCWVALERLAAIESRAGRPLLARALLREAARVASSEARAPLGAGIGGGGSAVVTVSLVLPGSLDPVVRTYLTTGRAEMAAAARERFGEELQLPGDASLLVDLVPTSAGEPAPTAVVIPTNLALTTAEAERAAGCPRVALEIARAAHAQLDAAATAAGRETPAGRAASALQRRAAVAAAVAIEDCAAADGLSAPLLRRAALEMVASALREEGGDARALACFARLALHGATLPEPKQPGSAPEGPDLEQALAAAMRAFLAVAASGGRGDPAVPVALAQVVARAGPRAVVRLFDEPLADAAPLSPGPGVLLGFRLPDPLDPKWAAIAAGAPASQSGAAMPGGTTAPALAYIGTSVRDQGLLAAASHLYAAGIASAPPISLLRSRSLAAPAQADGTADTEDSSDEAGSAERSGDGGGAGGSCAATGLVLMLVHALEARRCPAEALAAVATVLHATCCPACCPRAKAAAGTTTTAAAASGPHVHPPLCIISSTLRWPDPPPAPAGVQGTGAVPGGADGAQPCWHTATWTLHLPDAARIIEVC